MSISDQPSEEELRAAYESEIKKISVEQIVLEQVVSLVNLGMRRTGLSPGTEDERDVSQVRVAIEAVRGLLPLIDQIAPQQSPAIRDALSQLQLAFVRLGGAAGSEAAAGTSGAGTSAAGTSAAGTSGAGTSGAGTPGAGTPAPEPPEPGEPGPAQRSGRLWIPGQ